MARIKGAINAKKKHKRVLKLAKGYRGARSKQYRIAKQSVMRAMASAFAGRKQRKRDMRSLQSMMQPVSLLLQRSQRQTHKNLRSDRF